MDQKKLEAIEAKNRAKHALWLMQEQANENIEQKFPEDDLYQKSVLSAPVEVACPICKNIMESPNKPTTLFPCGHTVCQGCVTELIKNGNVCCLCKQKIKTTAINYTLSNIIDAKNYKQPQKNNGVKDELENIKQKLLVFEPQYYDALKISQENVEKLVILQDEFESIEEEVKFDVSGIEEQRISIANLERKLVLLRDEEANLKKSLAVQIKEVEKLRILAEAGE